MNIPKFHVNIVAKGALIVFLLCSNIAILQFLTVLPAQAHCRVYHPHHCKPKDVIREVKKTFETVVNEVNSCIKGGCDPTQADLDVWSELVGEGGRQLYPGAAATMELRHSGTKYSLNRWQRDILRPHFGDLVDRVFIVYNARLLEYLGSYKGVTISMPGFSASAAQTFGYTIYVDESQSDSFSQLALLAHELVHAQQYEKYGESLSNFGYHYFKSYARNGFVYEKISLEEEAYNRVNGINAALVDAYSNHEKLIRASRKSNVAVPYYGDFNGDGKSDLVWRRQDDTLEARLNLLDGGTLLADVGLPIGDPGWKVVGIGDFNGDGKSDLAWRRQDDTLEVRLNLLDGNTLLADVGLPAGDPGWKVVGVGDFNGDGKDDLAWRRQDDTLEVRLNLLDGGTRLADVGLPIGDPGWKVVGVGDFNGDGKDDLAWRRQDDTLEVRLNLLDGGTLLADVGLPIGDPGWKVIGVGDFNGDGKDDLAWRRQDDTLEVRLNLLDGGTLLADVGLPAGDPGWKVVGVGDFNGDGKDDLAWRRQDDTLEVRLNLLNGGTLLADVGLPVGDPGWKVVPD